MVLLRIALSRATFPRTGHHSAEFETQSFLMDRIVLKMTSDQVQSSYYLNSLNQYSSDALRARNTNYKAHVRGSPKRTSKMRIAVVSTRNLRKLTGPKIPVVP